MASSCCLLAKDHSLKEKCILNLSIYYHKLFVPSLMVVRTYMLEIWFVFPTKSMDISFPRKLSIRILYVCLLLCDVWVTQRYYTILWIVATWKHKAFKRICQISGSKGICEKIFHKVTEQFLTEEQKRYWWSGVGGTWSRNTVVFKRELTPERSLSKRHHSHI